MIRRIIEILFFRRGHRKPAGVKSERKRYYKILRIRPTDSLKRVDEAYQDLAWKVDPRRFAYDERLERRAKEIMAEIDEAYAKISRHGRKAGGARSELGPFGEPGEPVQLMLFPEEN